jgi:hypothetical protein
MIFDFIVEAMKNWRDINEDQGPNQMVVFRRVIGGPLFRQQRLILES